MGYKKTYIVITILVILLLAVFFLERPLKDRHEDRGKEVYLFEGLQIEDAAKIEIISEGQKVTLEKVKGLWFVGGKEGYKADPKAVDGMLHTIGKLNRKNLVSKNPKKQEVFQVDEKAGAEVKVYNTGGKVLSHLFLGKSGPDFLSTYIRRAGEEEVYLAEGYLKGTFVKSPQDWRDRTIFDFEPEYISMLTLDRGERRIVARREDSEEWTLIEPQEKQADKGKLQDMAYTLAKLKASGFAEEGEPKDYDWGNPKIRVVALLKDGAEKILLVGAEKNKKDNFYVKKEGEDTVFVIPKYVVEKFDRKVADLEAKAQMKAE